MLQCTAGVFEINIAVSQGNKSSLLSHSKGFQISANVVDRSTIEKRPAS